MKKKNEAIDWYIKGEYHCDKCPFGWDTYSEYLGDGDCGCYIFGDIRDTCRLIPPIRFILGWFKRKRAEYYEAHAYDNYLEWSKERDERTKRFNALFEEDILDKYAVLLKDRDGNTFGESIDAKRFCKFDDVDLFRWDCEDLFSPPSVPLKERWAQLIKDTWHKFIMIFKPYFCK